jgi:hypothetical protein
MVQHIALELKKKDAQKLGDDQVVWLYGGVGAGSASFGQTAGIGKVGALGLRKAGSAAGRGCGNRPDPIRERAGPVEESGG